MNGRPGNRAGFITLKALIWLLILASALYGAYKFAPPYLGYYMLKTEVQEEAKVAHMYSDEAIARRILQKAAVWSVIIDAENLAIDRGRESILIAVHYTVLLSFPGGYEKELVYDISVQRPLKDPGGQLR